MSEVPKVSNEIDGCQVKTKLVKRAYVFCWSIENFPPYPSVFQMTSPEFHPKSDRLFCATVERKQDNIQLCTDVIFSIFIKEGLPIKIKHTISITNSTGKIIFSTNGRTHQHSLASGCSPTFKVTIPHDSKKFKTEDYPYLNFKCTMEYDESSTQLLHNYQLPRSTISLPTLLDDLKSMYAKSLHADLCLEVGKEILRVHKALLCARSPVFAKMFEKKNNIIEITDIELPVVKGLVEFVYTGVLCNEDFVCEMYYAADKYDVASLRKTCTDVLLAKLDVENAFRFLSLADQHSDGQFKDSVMEFILFHFDDILQTKNWFEFLDNDTKMAA